MSASGLSAAEPQLNWLAESGRAALAVSGGADSLALMVLMRQAANRVGVRPESIIVYSVDHRLRPEAAEEVAYVVRTARDMGFSARALAWEGEKPATGIQAAARTARYRLMAAALAPTPEDEVLDVACGWGEFLLSHANQARLVAGIDVSKKKVALARQRLAARIAGGTAEVVQGDAGTLPWVEATFTAVTCMDAFPFFSAPDRVVAEVFRVLRPGGRMLMQIGMRWPDGPPKHMPHPVSPLAGDEVASRRLVEDAGFREVTITYGRVGGENRLGNAVSRWTAGSDELRLVGAVKPG